MREKKDNPSSPPPLPVYESHPPEWLPQIHGTADLGYPGFYPPRPGQDEDILSASNIKNGFVLPQPVSVETFSAQSMINEKLRNGDTLSKLEELMNEVFARRAERTSQIPPSSFRMPTRVTLNDAKRQAWFADLANPDVPLYKLGKSVPHGAKGHDLLDLLQSHDVAIPRAVWVLRVFGANETAGLRNKPSYNPTQYSVEWANVVTGYLKKQLYEIALPSAPRPGLNIKQTFKGVLSEADSRERWMSRFAYSLKLLRTFYYEGLVDRKTFLVWLVQQMAVCNLAQAGFITRLVDEYLDDILGIRPLARPLAEACLSKVAEICGTSAQDILVNTETLLKVLLQRLCLAIPDVFIGPRLWLTHSSLLETIMAQNLLDVPSPLNDVHMGQSVKGLQETLRSNIADIRRRNEALSFRNSPVRVSAKLSAAVSLVKLLNSLSRDSQLSAVSYFEQDVPGCPFPSKLDMLLTWSVTPLQYGDHRPLAAVTLIQQWRDKASERATRRGSQHPHEFLQDHLFEWLDTSGIAGEASNIQAVALLYGKLVKLELFSYPNYIQRLIARGEPGLSYSEPNPSRHRHFLSWIPLFNSTPSLIYQRKVTLYGVRARETPEERLEKEIRQEIRSIIPELSTGELSTRRWLSTTELLEDCKSLVTASRYEQVRTFRQWLLPTFRKAVSGNISQAALARAYCISVELMDFARCFNSILEIALCMLLHVTDIESITCVLDTFQRHSTIWACMDAMPKIVHALHDTHHRWKARGLQSRTLLSMLLEFDNRRYLSPKSRDEILADMNAFVMALHPVMQIPDPVPDVLPEIDALAHDPNPEAPSTLANSLWIKYRSSHDWAAKAWENTLNALQSEVTSRSEEQDLTHIGLRYANFLLKVDQHLPTGLDGYILQWFNTVGKDAMPSLQPQTWHLLEYILIFLIIRGALATTTVLSGLVYPAWRLAASSEVTIDSPLLAYLKCARELFQKLLLQDVGNGEDQFPRDIFDIQKLRTRRRTVYYEPHFSTLVDMIPLLIYVESMEQLPSELREELSSLRRQLCQDRRFRQGAYRDLDVIREAFETSPFLMDTSDESLRRDAVAGLRMILWDSVGDGDINDWPEVTSLLSPWKLAATTIQMQFQVKQLGRALGQENTYQFASNNLDKLTVKLFQHTKTAEEAYSVGEMTRGADPTVAMKFIKAGLNFMKAMLSDVPVEEGVSLDSVRRLGELLRILIHVTTPFRAHSMDMLALDSSLQEEFLQLLHSKIAHLESSVTSPGQQDQGQKSNLILLIRLLQFILNFREISWTTGMRQAGHELASVLFRLVMHFGSGSHIDDSIFPILMDTLLFIYDEMAPDPKVPSYDPFRYYQDIPPSSLPTDLPSEYRHQILTLITQQPALPIVSNLGVAHHDAQGNTVFDGPVVNRPWEWVENLGDPSVHPNNTETLRNWFDQKASIKNSGSLPLETFGARLTGDIGVYDLTQDPDILHNLRTFEDGLSSESIFARDWRETRIDIDKENAGPHIQVKMDGGQVMQFYSGTVKSDLTSRESPASSVVSRSSAHASNSSKKRSPSQMSRVSTSTISDAMDSDITSSRRGSTSKRKIESDDEIEIVEGPVPARSMGGKRTRAGKGPAGKTTMGKTRATKKR